MVVLLNTMASLSPSRLLQEHHKPIKSIYFLVLEARKSKIMQADSVPGEGILVH